MTDYEDTLIQAARWARYDERTRTERAAQQTRDLAAQYTGTPRTRKRKR